MHLGTRSRSRPRSRFGLTEFNWQNHRVRIGDVWKDSQFTIGGAPLMRAYMSGSIFTSHSETNYAFEVSSGNEGKRHFDVNPDLTNGQKEELIILLQKYTDVFADNPKSPPTVVKGDWHVIDTGSANR